MDIVSRLAEVSWLQISLVCLRRI